MNKPWAGLLAAAALLAGGCASVADVGGMKPAPDRGVAVKPAAPGGGAVGKQWLLVVGIDKYQDSRWPPLQCAVSDAKAVRDLLVRRYVFDEVLELYDGQATLEAMTEKLRWLATKTEADDGVLIYYAGHGNLDTVEGIGSWIPVDGTPSPTTWLDNDRIRRTIANTKARHILLVSDSCFAGDFFKGTRGSLPQIDEPYYQRAYEKPSRQALTSGSVEPVADGALKGHSPFAHWLLWALERNEKPYLTPFGLFDQIKEGVARNSGQTPRVGYLRDANDAGGEYVLFLRDAKTPIAKAPLAGLKDSGTVVLLPETPTVLLPETPAQPESELPRTPPDTNGLWFTRPVGGTLTVNKNDYSIRAEGTLVALKKGRFPFRLRVPAHDALYGTVEVLEVSNETKGVLFGKTENGLFKETHLEAAWEGRPVLYKMHITTASGQRVVIQYTMGLRPVD